MLCDCCKKREAKIYYTEILDGEKKEQHLCEECAAEQTSFFMIDTLKKNEFFLGGLLAGILGGFSVKTDEPACVNCKLTLDKFFKSGRFGCPKCYESFGENLSKLFKNIQGGDTHNGKVPVGYKAPKKALDDKKSILNDSEKLRLKLQHAIEKEEFEEAAKLRDAIKLLKEEETHGKVV